MDPMYTTGAWYHESEGYYDFGPFTLEEVTAFISAHPEREWVTAVLNPPDLYGTGKELA